MTDTDATVKEEQTEPTTLYEALAAAQADLENPKKNKTATVKGTSRKTGKSYEMTYKYADIGDVLKTVLPVLSRHGLSVSQPTKILENNSVILVTRIAHKSGEFMESEYPVSGPNNDHQAMGAALTYARRYALTSLIGVSAVDDNDGSDAAQVGDGGARKMSIAEAKKEVNWDEVENAINGAQTFEEVNKFELRIEERKSVWPDSFYSSAKDLIYNRRLEIAGERLGAKTDENELTDEFSDIEALLGKKVRGKDLSDLYGEHRDRLFIGQSPLSAG